MEIMEIREAIDTTSKQAEIQALVQKIKSQIAATANELADAFDTKDLELALRLTAELQYWNRCMDTLREKPCFGCSNNTNSTCWTMDCSKRHHCLV
jgi:hypothetical protein